MKVALPWVIYRLYQQPLIEHSINQSINYKNLHTLVLYLGILIHLPAYFIPKLRQYCSFVLIVATA